MNETPLAVIIPPCAGHDFAAIVEALTKEWPKAVMGDTPRGFEGMWVYLRGKPPEQAAPLIFGGGRPLTWVGGER